MVWLISFWTRTDHTESEVFSICKRDREREREERGSVNVIDRGDNHTAVGVTVVETTALFISYF
jgi:hypothetical protein